MLITNILLGGILFCLFVDMFVPRYDNSIVYEIKEMLDERKYYTDDNNRLLTEIRNELYDVTSELTYIGKKDRMKPNYSQSVYSSHIAGVC